MPVVPLVQHLAEVWPTPDLFSGAGFVMGRFKEGDEVCVVTTRYDGVAKKQSGNVGKITEVHGCGESFIVVFDMERPENKACPYPSNGYHLEDLELAGGPW